MLSSMLCTPKSDAYPILQNAVECRTSWFCRTIILNQKIMSRQSIGIAYKCQCFCFVKDWQAADWFFRCEAALAYIGR